MHPKSIARLLFLLVYLTSCTNVDVPSGLPTEVSVGTATDSEATVTLVVESEIGMATDSEPTVTMAVESEESSSPMSTSTPTTPVQPALDLIMGMHDGTISVDITNGPGGVGNHVDLLIQNKSDTAVQIKSPPGLLIADDQELTTDLVLPAINELLIPPGSEENIPVPAYEVAFRYPTNRFPGQDYEVKIEDFINPVPLPESLLSVVGIDARLGAVLEAAVNTSPPVSHLAIQMAIYAVTSDVRVRWVGVCGSQVHYAGTFHQGNAISNTVYWYDCRDGKLRSDLNSGISPFPDEEIYKAREILRKFAESNSEFAPPFRVVINQNSPAFSNEQVRSAMVTLVDQERLIEHFGFGVTFHLMSNGKIPDDLAIGLPQVTDGGMSTSEALAFLDEWTALNGPLKFVWLFEDGNPAYQMVDIVMTDWYEIDVIPELLVAEFTDFPGAYIGEYLGGNFSDLALEHRPGLLP